MTEAGSWVALIDDDPSVLRALGRTLRLRGKEVRSFDSAAAFLAALPHGLPCCLVLDLQMPGMTGLDLLRYLKREGISVPAVIITANGDDATRDRCALAGATAFLAKPLNNASLFAAIDAAIVRSHPLS